MARSSLRALVPSPLFARRRWSATDARTVLAQVARSGLSLREFATRANLSVQRLYRWQAQLGAGSSTPAFVEIKPAPAASVTIEVVLRSGHVLRVPEGSSEEAVRRVVAALDEGGPQC
jgi:transposase-like protein